jgi:hypothetical protein
MPTYTFVNDRDEEVLTDIMPWTEAEAVLRDNPGWRLAVSSPMIVDPMRIGVKKPDAKFREHLGRMKRFYRNNTMGD